MGLSCTVVFRSRVARSTGFLGQLLRAARRGDVHFIHDGDDEGPHRGFRVFEDLAGGVSLVLHEDGLAHSGPDHVEREDVARAVGGSVRQDGPDEELFSSGIEGVLDCADDRSEDAPEDHRITFLLTARVNLSMGSGGAEDPWGGRAQGPPLRHAETSLRTRPRIIASVLSSRLEMMLLHEAHHGVVHRDEPRLVQERGLAGRFPRH